MKKLNKIIPLACLATTLPCVAPVLASCAQETKYVFDLTDVGYGEKPNRINWDGSDLNSQKATKLYCDMVTNDPKQFIYDYMYGRNKFIHSIAKENNARIKSFTLSSTLPKFGKTTASFSHEPDMEYPTASFTIEGHLDIVLDLDPENGTENKMNLVVDSKVTYKDCIFYAYADESRGKANSWTVGMMDLAANATDGSGTCIAYLYNNNPWSIDVNYNCDATATYYDPETGTHTTSTQNYNFKRKLDDYFSLNDVLQLTYNYRSRDLDSFPVGFLWYLIPMDFASAAFTNEGGDPIAKEIQVSFVNPSNWVFWLSGNQQLSVTFENALYITGLSKEIQENNINVDPRDLSNHYLVYTNNIKEIAAAEMNGDNGELTINVVKPTSTNDNKSNENWNLEITWKLSDTKYEALDTYFTEGAGRVKTIVPYIYKEGGVTVTISGEPYDINSNTFWSDTIRLDFTKIWGR